MVWSLNSIAIELENPFGEDDNDLPATETQRILNRELLLLLRPSTLRTPGLSGTVVMEECQASFGLGPRSSMTSDGVQLPSKTGSSDKDDLNRRTTDRKISLGALRNSIGHAPGFDFNFVPSADSQSNVLAAVMDEMRRAGERAAAEV